MSFLADVIGRLEIHGIPSALIGAAALAVHGVARATEDVDLLAVDARVLDEQLWRSLHVEGISIRRGDVEDPLAGFVRLQSTEVIVEVVVGKGEWMHAMLGRRTWMTLRAERIPVVDAADLVLLKLYAGGPQDLLDARLLLASDPATLLPVVEARLPAAPAFLTAAWRNLARDTV
jgi:hypothetical protein